MIKKYPLVSILIPTYNREKYLGSALESALKQTYKNIEIIVHDDASTDGTAKLLKKYADPRLRLITTAKNHGMIGGWNFIVTKARGQYIKFLASDDLLAPTCVTELVTAALAHPSAALITCQRKFIDEEGGVVKTLGFTRHSSVISGLTHAHWILTTLRQNLIGEPTAVLYPTKLVKKAGQFDAQFSQFADFEYWIRLLQFGDLVYVHRPLCSFRLHNDSNTSATQRDGRFITETFALLRKYYGSPAYCQAFNLTSVDLSHVTKIKTLDTLKNIKDLLLSGYFIRASQYMIKLTMGIGIIHHHRFRS